MLLAQRFYVNMASAFETALILHYNAIQSIVRGFIFKSQPLSRTHCRYLISTIC